MHEMVAIRAQELFRSPIHATREGMVCVHLGFFSLPMSKQIYFVKITHVWGMPFFSFFSLSIAHFSGNQFLSIIYWGFLNYIKLQTFKKTFYILTFSLFLLWWEIWRAVVIERRNDGQWARTFNGTLVHWYNGTLVQWYIGTVVQHIGTMS